MPAGADLRTVDELTEIARRYYLQGESQIEIARDLEMDPSTVSRYLKRAREDGIVHVEIRPPRRLDVDLGRMLGDRFGLARVIVASTDDGMDNPLPRVAAEFVEGILRTGMRVGVSWGRTLADVVHHLRPGSVSDLSIAQLAGGIADPTPGIQGHEVARAFADLYPPSQVHYLHAPATVASVEIRDALISDPSIRTALAAAKQCELALVGIGQISAESTLMQGQHVSAEDWAILIAAGAVGSMNTLYFDASGRPIADLARRTIAATWDDLRGTETVVAIAGGAAKALAIEAALRTGCVDILITDQAAASALLEATADHSDDARHPAATRQLTVTSSADSRTRGDGTGSKRRTGRVSG
jgi:deoxyribonucleoside regulator